MLGTQYLLGTERETSKVNKSIGAMITYYETAPSRVEVFFDALVSCYEKLSSLGRFS